MWDLPTRVFHAVLAVAVITAIVTAKIGGALIEWHARAGLLVLALLAFRLAWGVVGGHWSRLNRLLHGPTAVWRYLRGRPSADGHADVGHSPLGSWAVWAMLLALAAQVATGLVADDEIAYTGPLNAYVGSDTAAAATHYHEAWGQWLVIGLVVLHLVAVLFYALVRRRPLLPAMWHGDQWVPTDAAVPASHDTARQRWLAAILFGACLGGARWVYSLGG